MHVLLVSEGHWPVSDSTFEGWAQGLSRSESGFDVVLADGPAPDVIFTGPCPESALPQVIARIKQVYPNAAVIPFLASPGPDVLLSLLRSGVADVLTKETPAAFREIAERTGKVTAPAVPTTASAKAIRRMGFISAKGGVGSTVLLANLGMMLAKTGGARVLLVDLTLPFGDLDMYLTTQKPDHDLADLAGEVDRLDQALFKAMVHHVNDKVDLIPCPQGVERVMQVTPIAVSRLIQVVAGSYDVVLFDFGSTVDPVKLPLLETLDQLAIVAMLDVPNARHTSQLYDLLKGLDFPLQKTSLIINRHVKDGPITQDELEDAVGRPVDRVMPDAGQVITDSLAQGLPAVEAQPASAFAEKLEEWAAELLGLPQKRKSFWQRLRNR